MGGFFFLFLFLFLFPFYFSLACLPVSPFACLLLASFRAWLNLNWINLIWIQKSKKRNGSVTHKSGRERNTTPGTRGKQHTQITLSESIISCHVTKKENASITTRVRRKAAPRKVGRGRQHPEEGGGEGTSPKRRDERAAPPKRSSTTPKTDWNEREERNNHPKEECEPPPYFNSLHLALVWFNFLLNLFTYIFSFLSSFKCDRHDHPKEAEEGNTTQTEEEKNAAHPQGRGSEQHQSRGGEDNSTTLKQDRNAGEPPAAPPTRGEEGMQHHPKGGGRTTTLFQVSLITCYSIWHILFEKINLIKNSFEFKFVSVHCIKPNPTQPNPTQPLF